MFINKNAVSARRKKKKSERKKNQSKEQAHKIGLSAHRCLIFKFDGVYIERIDGTALIIAALLFCFFMAKLFAACMLQYIICFFAK